MKKIGSRMIKNGIAHTRIRQGKKVPPRDVEKENKIKDFCLNCDKPYCNGSCDEIVAFIRKIKNG